MPGHHDAGNEYTSLEDTIKATKEAMDMGLAGTNNKWVKLISFYRIPCLHGERICIHTIHNSLYILGIMTWDINRDTDQRMNYPAGTDNLYQTGQGKATYINAISSTINEEH